MFIHDSERVMDIATGESSLSQNANNEIHQSQRSYSSNNNAFNKIGSGLTRSKPSAPNKRQTNNNVSTTKSKKPKTTTVSNESNSKEIAADDDDDQEDVEPDVTIEILKDFQLPVEFQTHYTYKHTEKSLTKKTTHTVLTCIHCNGDRRGLEKNFSNFKSHLEVKNYNTLDHMKYDQNMKCFYFIVVSKYGSGLTGSNHYI